ncbi:multidrug/spermidine efflux SMR transporter subunit MdtI [Sandaracinobacteroides sayramensis]|uniref:multidrug/spermidine efflux SMR transporter subunit MdtI n=1 Tax=Sandaracinobacteroides sayramensis TaxID=2913411 RepID=UPI002342EA2E|nr:multidrug/spermidine efflux SMR transporter subunit MdtI [Sandaracinobacteroides sayramensis]
MAIAIGFEVLANILIKLSDGFRKRWIGLLGIASILASFTALSQAVKGIDLSVAYALWGGSGILFTSLIAWFAFGQRIKAPGFAGIALMLGGIFLLRLA